MKMRFKITAIICIALCMVTTGCGAQVGGNTDSGIELSQVPEYSGQPYVAINNNEPEFDEGDFTVSSFEAYSSLDSLGRCGLRKYRRRSDADGEAGEHRFGEACRLAYR